MSQLPPTLLPPTSSSEAHSPHPAHLQHTHSPTTLLGRCCLLPALSNFPCSGSKAFPVGMGLWISREVCHADAGLPSIDIQQRKAAGLRLCWLAAGQPWLPAHWRGCWQLCRISSPLGPLRAPTDRRGKEGNEFSVHSSPQGQAILHQVSSSLPAREPAPAASPAPGPAQSKGDGVQGRPSPWLFAASWFPELA